MKTFNWILLLTLLTFSCNSDDELVTEPDPEIESRNILVAAINDQASEISSSHPTENISELEVLDQLAGTRIIGLGEASHGTKEFFEMKHKILRYFVENHGYRGIIMEADFGECLKANEYVLNDIGTIDELMQNMHFWVWKTEEVKTMIQWMHDYNLSKPLEEKVYYLGSDCQFVDDNLDLVETKIAAFPSNIQLSITNYLDKLNSDLRDIVEFDVSTIDSMLLYTDSLILEIENHQIEIEALSSEQEYDILRQLAVVAHQAYEVSKGNITEDIYNYRDQYMGDNTLWLADHVGADQNFIVWAHNFHVSKYDVDVDYGTTQGGQLKVLLGEDYKSIGFSMAVGSVNAVRSGAGIQAGPLPNTPTFGSINELFYLTEKENFIWVFDDATRNNSVFDWFNQWRDWISIGSGHPLPGRYYTSIKVFEDFDSVIHFHRSNPTELIQ